MAMVSKGSDQTIKEYKILCSVCIANYNGENFLEECIESVLRQVKFQNSLEIIVHDDCSTDGSVALLQSRYPKIRILTSEKNVGFCKSNNRMAAVASGRFLLLLNNDAVLHKDALKTLYESSQKHGEGIFGLPQYDADTGELIDIGSTFDLFLNPIPNKDIKRQDVGMIIGACLWLPVCLWDQLGGFPEWFESLAEDMFICCFARILGYPVKAISQSGFDHWVGKSFGGGKVLVNKILSTSKRRRKLSERNKTFVMIIFYPFVASIILIPIHLFLLIVEGILLSVIKWDYGIWSGIYWGCLKSVWMEMGMLYRTRKSVQALRKSSTRIFFQPFCVIPHKIRMLLRFGIPSIDT